MDFDTATDLREQGDGKFAAEMLAEFLEPGQDGRQIGIVRIEQFVGEESEPEPFQQVQNPLRGRGGEQAGIAGINDIQRNANGHRLAVGNAKMG